MLGRVDDVSLSVRKAPGSMQCSTVTYYTSSHRRNSSICCALLGGLSTGSFLSPLREESGLIFPQPWAFVIVFIAVSRAEGKGRGGGGLWQGRFFTFSDTG